jgi:Tol biopolymer transport system component
MPDGRSFLYFVSSSRPDVQGIYTGSLGSERATRVTPAPSNVAFVQPGFLVFRMGGRLVAQSFNWKESRLKGEVVQVAESVAGSDVIAYFTAVPDALAYIPGVARPTTLTWLDRKGSRLGTAGERGEYSGPALSPDERTLAVALRDPAIQTRDIWLIDLARGIQQRFTFDPADDMNPAWSPDGSRVAFTSARKGMRDIWEKAASGVGEERMVLGSEIEKNMEYWSPDGRLLLFNVLPGSGARQIWALPLEGERKPFAVLSGPADVTSSPLSPDGKFIAYGSSESGRYEIFIQDFPHARNRLQISTEGGTLPQWRADSKELFYLAGSKLMAVDIKVSGTRLEAGVPHPLFEAPFAPWGRNTFVPSRDGQRFLAIVQVEQPADLSITVELNWMSRLKQ